MRKKKQAPVAEKQKTILLVEDEAILAISQKMSLSKIGYRVLDAYSGEKALEIFKKNSGVNLVLMDIDLGRGMDGPETARRMLEVRNTPIVFLSNHTEPEIISKTEKITSYGYIVKDSGITAMNASIKMAFKLYESNEKLREMHNRLEATLRALPDPLFEFGLDGFIYDCKSTRPEFMINPIEGIINHNVNDIMPTWACDAIMKAIIEANEKGYSFGNLYHLDLPSGRRWFEVSMARKASSPENPRFIMLRHDITERVVAEQALKEKQKLVDEVQKLANLGSWSWDVQKDEISWSKELYSITKLNPQVPPPNFKNLHKFYSTESWIRLRGAVAKTLEENISYELELDMVCTDGEIRHTITRGSGIKDDSGRVIRLFGTAQDVTDRKVKEVELEQSNQKFRTLASFAPVGIYLTDKKGDCLYTNPTWCRMAGLTEEESLGKGWVKGLHPEDRDFVFSNWKRMIESQGKWGLEYRFGTPGEKETIVFGLAVPQYDTSGEVIHYIGVNLDITDRKKSENEIKSLLEEKEIILKEVHHRIRNNMSTIKSLLSLQSETLNDPAASVAIGEAASRIQCMKILYDKLFDSPTQDSISCANYLPSLIDEIMAGFPKNKPVSVKKKIGTFRLDVKKIQSLGIIINELLTNIMKYAFDGRNDGVISVSIQRSGKNISLVVQDNGVGIPPSINFQNTAGFGFVLVNLLTQQLGGTIRIERKKGTRIVMEFEE